MHRTILLGLVVCCLVGVGAVSAADHTLSVDGAMEVPERTVTVGGESYQVSALARVSRGDRLHARTGGGNGTGYRVYLHNANGSVVDQQYVAAAADGGVTFETSTYDAGSYVLSLYHDGTYYDPHPVVVPAYDVAVDVPTPEAGGDGAGAASVTLTEREPGHTVHRVTVVVSNETVTRRYSASRVDGEYVVALGRIRLAPGTYSVYAVVANGNDAPGPTNEVIGISDRSRLELDAGSATAGEHASAEPDDPGSAAESGRSTPPNDSGPVVITPERGDPETPDGLSSGAAGGVPFAILSLVVTVGFLAVRGAAETE